MNKVLTIALSLVAIAAAGQPQKKAISPDLFGIFFEDLNYAADGGLYAEMVQNRSFEYSPSDVDLPKKGPSGWHPFTAWEMRKDGNAIGRLSLESQEPIHPNNSHYARLTVTTTGRTGCGIANTGYDGMTLNRGEQYRFSAFLRCQSMQMCVRLVEADKVLAEQTIDVKTNGWQRFETTLTPTDSADNARLELRFTTRGTVDIDMVSLFPTETFKNRENGLRRDLAETIADLRPAFVRFPGGCLAHGDGLENIYRWKQTIGPIEQRKEDYNIWNYHQTFGLGYHELLCFCEDIGAKPLPVLAAGVSCQNSARERGTGQQAIPMDEMDEYVQDVLDLIEYCNGSVTSRWGSERAKNGHPKPFNLEYIGIGNEDNITKAFEERFEMIYKAVKARYPEIKVVGTSGPDAGGADFDNGWKVARRLSIDLVDEHYYKAPQWFLDNLQRYDSYDRNGPKVYLGEYASRGNRLFNAIAEAAYMTAMERNGDVVSLSSYAPLLSRVGHTQWKPDMIFFDKRSVMPSVNYHVQRLFSRNSGDTYWSGIVSGTETVSCVEDSKSGDVILKLVNATYAEQSARIDLSPLRRLPKRATVTTLTGDREAEQAEPTTTERKFGKRFDYTLPPFSLTIIRFSK